MMEMAIEKKGRSSCEMSETPSSSFISDSSLQCTLVSDDDAELCMVRPLRRDEQKKAVFWLDPPSENKHHFHSIAAPAHCFLDSTDEQIFFLGGFQIVTNAKTIEVYLENGKEDDINKNKDETYLTTTRGIPHKLQDCDGDDDTTIYYKFVCVIPGGPRAVRKVHLKMLSLAAKALVCRIASVKLTARLPETTVLDPSASNRTDYSSPRATNPSNASNPGLFPSAEQNWKISSPPPVNNNQNKTSDPPPISSDDLGAAMAGVSFMMRSTEDRIYQRLETLHVSLQQQMAAATISQQESTRNFVLAQQQALVDQQQQQQKLILHQQTILMQQQEFITNLLLRQYQHNEGSIPNGNSSGLVVMQTPGKHFSVACSSHLAQHNGNNSSVGGEDDDDEGSSKLLSTDVRELDLDSALRPEMVKDTTAQEKEHAIPTTVAAAMSTQVDDSVEYGAATTWTDDSIIPTTGARETVVGAAEKACTKDQLTAPETTAVADATNDVLEKDL
jgi:hypothetical protein